MKPPFLLACGLASALIAGGCTFDSSQLRALGPDGGLGGASAGWGQGGTGASAGSAGGNGGASVAGDGGGGAGGTGGQVATTSSIAPGTCVPGASVACACSNGEQGAQICTSAGTFAACSCAALPDAGGVGGSGGAVAPDAAGGSGASDASPFDAPAAIGGSGGGTTSPGAAPIACANPTACTDFPSPPINDPNSPSPVPSNAASQFSGAPSGSGPCVTEPEDGALFPYNWTRPRIKWSSTGGLVQITVHADIETNDLVVYTTADNWIMDKDIWQGLASHVHDSDISVTVRAASGGATSVKFQIASASAEGSIVFWAGDPSAVGNQNVTTVDDTTSLLRGFTVGEEGTVVTLKFSQVQQPSRDQSYNVRTPTCIGCHSATPDSGFVAFVDNWPWNSMIAGVTPDNVGAELTNLTPGGLSALDKPWVGASTFSAAFWQTGNRMMVTTSAQQNDTQPWETDDWEPAKLVWYNLDGPQPTQSVAEGPVATPGQQYGVIARNGDPNPGTAFPTWSHDGQTIVYSSTVGPLSPNNFGGCQDGRLNQGATDLYSVPYNGGNGGDANPVPGASDKNWEEFYAAYSPDDQMVLFDRVPSGQLMYANPNAEIFFVPMGTASGVGTAVRLAANDPVQCTGMSSPGINNHFPKWAPAAGTYNGRTYYWIVYSSNRAGIPPVTSPYDGLAHQISQLYLTAISVENGTYTTYKSIYLWWQPTTTVNTTPVWGVITIPPAPPIVQE